MHFVCESSPRKRGEERRALLLPRSLYRSLLKIVRPAESAVRRLIFIAASRLAPRKGGVRPQAQQKPLPDFSGFTRNPDRVPSFQLIDPRKRFVFSPARPRPKHEPRVSFFPFTSSSRPSEARAGTHASDQSSTSMLEETSRNGSRVPLRGPGMTKEEEVINATTLIRRIEALNTALKTLPKQARRMQRLMERQAQQAETDKPLTRKDMPPMRHGAPPGYRQRPAHAVDDILKECHLLARDVEKPPGGT